MVFTTNKIIAEAIIGIYCVINVRFITLTNCIY